MNEKKSQIIEILKGGGVAVLPTDTLYALSADATSDAAVAKVFAVKQRPEIKALPVFYADIAEVERDFEMDVKSKELCEKFWPGSLSLVLRKKAGCSIADIANNGGDTVMVRIPNRPDLLELIREFGGPITGTSANISGEMKLIDSNLVDIMVTANDVDHASTPSTIVSCIGGEVEILREGAISCKEVNG